MMNLHCIRESDHAWKALGRVHLAANVLAIVQPALSAAVAART